MNTLILIAGLPGSGKSTIASILASKLQGHVLDIDVYKRETVDPSLVTKEIDPPHIRRIYYGRAVSSAFSLFQSGISTIIMEEVFHLAQLRNEMTEACRAAGVRVLWIQATCPYETVKARLSTKRREGHILSTEEALNMHLVFGKIFEPCPIDSEHIHVNNSGNDIDGQLSEISERLGILV